MKPSVRFLVRCPLAVALGMSLCLSPYGLGGSAIAAPVSFETKAFNPHPQQDDVIVALPCQGTMAFRKVYTSTSVGKLQDKAYTSGSLQSQTPLAQSPSHRFVQGAFHDKQGYYFLMSKYEVSAAQYRLLNADPKKCPTVKLGQKDTLPQTNLSWFEAVESTEKFSIFLAKNHKGLDDAVFARLPTDAEWEFAARGGLNVSKAEFNSDIFPFENEGDHLADYAWYSGQGSSMDSRPRPIGLKKPNPLGFYDILGNVSEMMLDPFYAVRTGRLHGQGGGFIVRGGSVLSDAGDMVSAQRVEAAYVNTRGQPTKRKDMGYRIVLAKPVTTNIQEVRQLDEELKAMGVDNNPDDSVSGANKNTIARLDKIIQDQKDNVTNLNKSNENLRASLKAMSVEMRRLRNDMIEVNSLRDEMRDKAIISSLRLGGYLCSSLAERQIVVENNAKREEVLRRVTLRPCRDEPESRACKRAQKEQEEQLSFSRFLAQNTLDFYVDYYADHVNVMLETFDIKTIQKLQDEALHDKSIRKVALGEYIKQFIKDLRSYNTQSRDLPEAEKTWVKQCRLLKK